MSDQQLGAKSAIGEGIPLSDIEYQLVSDIWVSLKQKPLSIHTNSVRIDLEALRHN